MAAAPAARPPPPLLLPLPVSLLYTHSLPSLLLPLPVSLLYTHSLPPLPGAPGAKGLPLRDTLARVLALARVLLAPGVEGRMGNLGGRPPAKLAAEAARVLPLLLRRVDEQPGGVDPDAAAAAIEVLPPFMADAFNTRMSIERKSLELKTLPESLSRSAAEPFVPTAPRAAEPFVLTPTPSPCQLLPLGLGAALDTAPLVRLHMLGVLAFLARAAADRPESPFAQAHPRSPRLDALFFFFLFYPY